MANNLQQVSRYLNHSQYFYRQLESTTFVPVALWDIPRRKYLFCVCVCVAVADVPCLAPKVIVMDTW